MWAFSSKSGAWIVIFSIFYYIHDIFNLKVIFYYTLLWPRLYFYVHIVHNLHERSKNRRSKNKKLQFQFLFPMWRKSWQFLVRLQFQKRLLPLQKNELQIRKVALETFCSSIHEAAQNNNGKLPYRYMIKFVQENKRTCPWLNRDIMDSAFSRYKKKINDLGIHSEGPTSEIIVRDKSS